MLAINDALQLSCPACCLRLLCCFAISHCTLSQITVDIIAECIFSCFSHLCVSGWHFFFSLFVYQFFSVYFLYFVCPSVWLVVCKGLLSIICLFIYFFKLIFGMMDTMLDALFCNSSGQDQYYPRGHRSERKEANCWWKQEDQ